MQLQFVYKANTEEMIIYYGDEKIGTFNATNLVKELGQAHVKATMLKQGSTVIAQDFECNTSTLEAAPKKPRGKKKES